MIAVLTRTSNRPKYFSRCYDSVQKQSSPCRHYVLYDNRDDLHYLKEKKVYLHYIDRKHYEESHHGPPPKSALPPILSLHNLYFNEIYSQLSEEWVYHLDDDNYLVPNAFKDVIPHLQAPVDLVFLRIQHYTGLLPPDQCWNSKTLPMGFVDTGCFLARSTLLQKVRWDAWKCGDYRVLQQCAERARKILWINRIVMNMEQQGLGRRIDQN